MTDRQTAKAGTSSDTSAAVSARHDGGSVTRRVSVRRPLYVISTLRPGGAERVVSHLATNLHSQGLRPSIICLQEKGGLAAEIEAQGIPVHALGSMRAYDVPAIMRLRTLLKRLDPDVINVHDRWSLPYVFFANGRNRKRRAVFSAHGLMYGEPERARLKYRLVARSVSAVTAVSEEVAKRHAQYFGWETPITIVPNGVPDLRLDPDQRNRMRRDMGIQDDTFVFLAVGNVRPEKGYEDLLDAVAMLRAVSPTRRWVVLVAGRMDETRYCGDLSVQHERLRLGETVRFLGFRENVRALYAAAEAFVLASRSEGLPMVVLEAMMTGIPVIATRVGGVPHAVGDCGLLVDVARPDQLRQAMGLLLTNPALAETLGRRGRERAVAEYSVDRMAAQYLEVYAHALSAGS